MGDYRHVPDRPWHRIRLTGCYQRVKRPTRRLPATLLIAVLVSVQLPNGAGSAIAAPGEPDDPATLIVAMRTIRSSIPNDVTVSDGSGELVADTSLADGESLSVPDLVPDRYTITQAESTSSSSRIRGIECSDGQRSSSNTIDIDLAAGTMVTCTITNDPQTSSNLEVAVIISWNDAPSDLDRTFEVCIQGPSFPQGVEAGACQVAFAQEPAFPDQDVLAWQSLANGHYTVTQLDPGADWQVTLQHQNPIPIPGPAEIPGEPARAGFINSYSPPTTTEPPQASTTQPPSTATSHNTTAKPELASTGSRGALDMTIAAVLLVAIGMALVGRRQMT